MRPTSCQLALPLPRQDHWAVRQPLSYYNTTFTLMHDNCSIDGSVVSIYREYYYLTPISGTENTHHNKNTSRQQRSLAKSTPGYGNKHPGTSPSRPPDWFLLFHGVQNTHRYGHQRYVPRSNNTQPTEQCRGSEHTISLVNLQHVGVLRPPASIYNICDYSLSSHTILYWCLLHATGTWYCTTKTIQLPKLSRA